MTDTTEMIDPVTGGIIDEQQLAERLLEQAEEQGVDLLGPDGLLNGLTKRVLEAALDAEMTEHLGRDKHQPADGGSIRNGIRSKTVLTARWPVQIDVPRDREGSFDPKIVRKRQRRLTGVDEIVLSLTARGLTTGEVAAHFDGVYGAQVSKDTISRITDKVIEEMTEWQNRPLDRVYPAITKLWQNAWAEFVPFLDWEVEIRRVICSTNVIESLNARYSRAVRARGHFPNDAAALTCLYLVTRSLDPTGRGRARWATRWKPAPNAFAIAFEGRIN